MCLKLKKSIMLHKSPSFFSYLLVAARSVDLLSVGLVEPVDSESVR